MDGSMLSGMTLGTLRTTPIRSYSIPGAPTVALPGRPTFRQAIPLILSKVIRTRARSVITSRSSQTVPGAMWRMPPRLTSTRTGGSTKKTSITCVYLHRAEVHRRRRLQLHRQLLLRLRQPRRPPLLPQRHLLLRRPLHRRLRLPLLPDPRPHRGVVLLRRRDPDSRVIILPRRSPWLAGALAKAARRRRVKGDQL